jgi:hypothetical protein
MLTIHLSVNWSAWQDAGYLGDIDEGCEEFTPCRVTGRVTLWLPAYFFKESLYVVKQRVSARRSSRASAAWLNIVL